MMLRFQILVQIAVLLLMVVVHGVEGADATTEQAAYVGQDAVLRCPLTAPYAVSYPGWMKMPDVVYMLNGGLGINTAYADRVSYASDNTSLVIRNITLSDNGSYRCVTTIDGGISRNYGFNTLHTRIRPQPPVISNRQSDGSVTGTEGQSLTLTCTSRGGYPAPTVTWYRSSTQSTVLASSNSGSLEGDGYTVTATYTFSPTNSDVGSIYICQTSYTSPKLDVLDSVNATLRLNREPSQPTVKQVGDVVAESTITVRCTTSGFRPAAITISWTYNGANYSPHVTPTRISGTDTYTATSTLQFTVHKGDNGERAECIVDHSTLGTPLTGTATIDVHYKPESATVTGNRVIVANGVNPLTLTCVVGERNPNATDIRWTRTSMTGTVSTQNPLVLRPTRDDDGDNVTCTADNTIGSVPSGPATLNLHFHPITTVTISPTGAVTEGPTDVTLQCFAYSKPAPTITWDHNGDTIQGGQLSTTAHNTYVSTYKITSVSRQDAGDYKCTAKNTVSSPTGGTTNTVTLVVQFPPLSAIIEDNQVIEADGQNKLYLTCVVGESNPISAISWSKTGTVEFGTKGITQDATGSYGGSTMSQVLELTPTRDNDGDTITCTANNGVGSSITNSTSLNLKYSANASLPRGDETVVEGAASKDLTCNANSKPAANFTWYKGPTSTAPLASGQGTGSDNQWTFTYTIVGVVDRSHAGRYRIVADNGVGDPDEKTMTLTVYYPPDVTATAQLNNEQLVVTCSPSGIPNSYYYSNWGHLWSDGTPISQTLAATQAITLTDLTYQDSGIYKCRAGNGVGLNGAMSANYIKQGSTPVITIKSLPIVLPIVIGPVEQKVPIELHEPTTVSITYYSNVAGSTVSCHRVVDNITQMESVGEVTTETSPIQLPVYGSVVPEQGTSATVTLTLNTEAELGAYVVKITNTVGTAVVHLLAVPEGPPDMPIDPRVEAVYTTSVNVSWGLGYHGGPGQIFIIQYSTDGEEPWTDGATLDTGNSTSRDRFSVIVDSLSPGTLYSLRIHVYNQHGSKNTAMINRTTSTIDEEGKSLPVGAIVGAAAGGLGAAAIVIVGIILFIRCRRSGTSGKDQAGLVMKDRRKFEDEESTGTGMIDNLVYVSADEVPPAVTPSTSGAAGINVYEDVVDNSKPSSSGNVEPVYSVVDKSNGAKVLPSTSGVASSDHAVVVKSKPPSPVNEDPMSLYSVVDKSNVPKGGNVDDKKKGKNKKDGKQEKKHKEKKADKKGKGAKAKKGASPDPGTVYENATNLMYENAKDVTKNKNGEENVYENPEDSQPKLAPKPKPTRNVNEEGCIYLDLDFKQEKGRELIIRGLDNNTDYADVEFGTVGPPCPDSDKEDDKTDDKKV